MALLPDWIKFYRGSRTRRHYADIRGYLQKHLLLYKRSIIFRIRDLLTSLSWSKNVTEAPKQRGVSYIGTNNSWFMRGIKTSTARGGNAAKQNGF